ncbi:MAG: Maf family protein [Candidatus Anstonellaceae archaeon]
MDIVLASASEERKRILKKIIKKFEIFPNTAKIRIKPFKNISQRVKSIAYFKALRICLKKPRKIIIAADTIVENKNKIFSKPKNKTEAKRFLKTFLGNKIKIYTSICLAYFNGESRPKTKCFCFSTTIKLKKLKENEIEKYISKNKWKNKAGAIDINDRFFLTFLESKIDKTQQELIAGLPSKHLKEKLAKFKKLIKKSYF